MKPFAKILSALLCAASVFTAAHFTGGMTVMADDKKNIVTLDFKGNVLELTTDSTDIGEAKDTIDVDFGKDFKIAFNYRYLVEVLKVIDTETVTFEMNTPLTACLIKSNFVHLIMPIQLRG